MGTVVVVRSVTPVLSESSSSELLSSVLSSVSSSEGVSEEGVLVVVLEQSSEKNIWELANYSKVVNLLSEGSKMK